MAGDSEEGWAELLATLTRYARGLTRAEQEAEELAQRTITRLLERRPDKAAHLGFAYTTMTRLWLSEQRRVRRRAARLASRAELCARAWQPAPDRAERDELVRRAQRAIESLAPRQRAALVLRVVEGLSYPAIAEHLECSVESVRSNLHLARARVRSIVGDP